MRNFIKLRSLLLAAATLTAALALAACGSDSKSSSTNGNSSPVASNSTSTSSSGPSGGGAAGVLNITAKEYSFDIPSSVTGGLVDVKLTNAGKGGHGAQFLKLKPGMTDAQFQKALQDPNQAAILDIVTAEGGVNSIAGGQTGEAFVKLTAGSYYLVSFDGPNDGPPDVAQGMLKAFTVTAPASDNAAAPKTDGKVTLADYNFLGVDTIPTTGGTYEVTDGGPQSHELALLKLNGITIDQFKAAIVATSDPGISPDAIQEAGGLAAISNGETAYLKLGSLPAGNYAFVCFVPDVKTGAPHAALGMVKAVTVK